MKNIFRYILLMLIMVIGFGHVHGQSHEAIYQYQNDDDFNAFMLERIDSIVYSRMGLDSVLYDDVVVEEVWFRGSCQRFLIDAIDSLTLDTPETKFKNNIFHLTEFHVPYTMGIDSLTLTFSDKIPSDRLPVVGQVVMSDVYNHPFEQGFAGRVKEINYTNTSVILVCERISILDIYDQLVAVGHVEAPDEKTAASRRNKVDVEDGHYDLFEDMELSTDIKDVLELSDKMNYSIDYTVMIGFWKKPVVKVYLNGSHELHFKPHIDVTGEKEWKHWPPGWEWNIPIPGLEILVLQLKLGTFFYAGGAMSLAGDVPLTVTHRNGFEWENNMITPVNEFNYEWGDPSVTLNVKGTVRAGVLAQIGINLISDKIVSANIQSKVGPQMDAELVLSSDGIRDLSWYKLLEDTKATLSLYTSVDAQFDVFGKDIEDVLNISMTDPWEKNWFETSRYLFPSFTAPALPPLVIETDESSLISRSVGFGGYKPTALMTIPKRNTLLPVKVGIGVYDRGGSRFAEQWADKKYWTEAADNEEPAKIEFDLSRFAPGETYTYRPIFKLAGFTVDAYPESEFTIPEEITMAYPSLMIRKGETRTVDVSGGWGIYQNKTAEQNIVVPELRIDETKEPASVKVDLKAENIGNAIVKLSDVRTGNTLRLPVTVVDPNAILLSSPQLELEQGQSAQVIVSGGSGQYEIINPGENEVLAEVSEQVVSVKGLKPGVVYVVVKDPESDNYSDLIVTVKEREKSIALEQDVVEVSAGTTYYIELTKGSGQYRVVNENPDIAIGKNYNGYRSGYRNAVEIVTYKAGTATINVQDLVTGDYVPLTVNSTNNELLNNISSSNGVTTYTVNGVPFNMVKVDGGSYTMGAKNNDMYALIDTRNNNNEFPTHQVTVEDFEIGQTEVTKELWEAVMGDSPHYWYYSLYKDGPESPTRYNSISSVNTFINKLNKITGKRFRLPMEREWEFAAKGGNKSNGYQYAGSSIIDNVAWWYDRYAKDDDDYDYNGLPHEVAGKHPNELGLYDMSGNVWELCNMREDYFNSKPLGVDDYVTRGGSFLSDAPWYNHIPASDECRVTSRSTSSIRYGTLDVNAGFRLAMGGSMFLDKTSLNIDMFRQQNIMVWNGSGNFSAYSENPEIATVEQTSQGFFTVTSVSGGNTLLHITDKESGEEIKVPVKIANNSSFKVSGKEVELVEADNRNYAELDFQGGNRFYDVKTTAPVTVSLDDDNKKVRLGLNVNTYWDDLVYDYKFPAHQPMRIPVTITDRGNRLQQEITAIVWQRLKFADDRAVGDNRYFWTVKETGKEVQILEEEDSDGEEHYHLSLIQGNSAFAEILRGSGQYKVESSNPEILTAELQDYNVIVHGVFFGTADITVTDTKTGFSRVFTFKCIPEVLKTETAKVNVPERYSAELEITQGSRHYLLENNSDIFSVELKGNIVKLIGLKAGQGEFFIKDKYSKSTVTVYVIVKEGLVISDTDISLLNGQSRKVGIHGTGSYELSFVNGTKGPDVIVVEEARKNDKTCFYALLQNDSLDIHAISKGVGSITVIDKGTGLSETVSINTDWQDLSVSKTEILLYSGEQESIVAETGSWSYKAETDRSEVLEVKQEMIPINNYLTQESSMIYSNEITVTAKEVNHLEIANVIVKDENTGQTKTVKVQVTPHVNTPYSSMWVEGPKVITTDPVEIPVTGSGQFSVRSSDPNIAVVTINNDKLKIRGLKAGEVTIIVTDMVSKDRTDFRAYIFEPLRLETDHVVVDNEEFHYVRVVGGGGSYYASSDNSDIAECEYAAYGGLGELLAVGITPRNTGHTTATVTDRITGQTKTFSITVQPSAFGKLKLSKDNLFINVGSFDEISVAGVGYENLEVTASDESVATVKLTSWSIKITGRQWGNSIITVRDKKSGTSQQLQVTVFKWIDSTWLKQGQTVTARLEGSGQYEVQAVKDINPHGISEYVVSDDELVSTRNEGDKLLITGIKAGTTTLRITDLQSGKVSMMAVTVDPAGDDGLSYGDFFTAKTIEDIDVSYMVLDVENRLCQVESPSPTHEVIPFDYNGNVTIPSVVNGYTVYKIGGMTFYGHRLAAVLIPNTIRDLGRESFKNCDNLTTIVSLIDKPFDIASLDVFDYNDKTTLYVPKGTKALYKMTGGWKNFNNIQEFEGEMPLPISYDDLDEDTRNQLMAKHAELVNMCHNIKIQLDYATYDDPKSAPELYGRLTALIKLMDIINIEIETAKTLDDANRIEAKLQEAADNLDLLGIDVKNLGESRANFESKKQAVETMTIEIIKKFAENSNLLEEHFSQEELDKMELYLNVKGYMSICMDHILPEITKCKNNEEVDALEIMAIEMMKKAYELAEEVEALLQEPDPNPDPS